MSSLQVAVDELVARVVSNPELGRGSPSDALLADEVDELARAAARHEADARGAAMGVAAALAAVRRLLRTPVSAATPTLQAPSGIVKAVWRAAGPRRALVLCALARLRGALDELGARGRAPDGAPPGHGARSTGSAWPIPPGDAALVAAVERTAVPTIVARALELAAALGAAHAGVAADGNLFAELERALLVACVHEGLPGTVLSEAAVQLFVALDAIRVHGGNGARHLVGHEAAKAAADRLAGASGALLGVSQDPLEVVETVAAVLRGTRAPSPGLATVAAALRGTPFLRLADERPARVQAAALTACDAARASADVPWLDRLNVLVRTDAEVHADHRAGDADDARRALHAVDVELRRQLVAACARFPPLGAHLELDAIRIAVQCLTTTVHDPYTRLSNDAIAARTRLAQWAIHVDRAWVPLVPALDLLERYATIQLATRAAFAHVR